MQTWWLSFCDIDKTIGNQFIGICIVEGKNFKDAHRNSHIYGCNPGGEVQAWNISKDAHRIKPEFKFKLLNKKQADEINLEEN